ncbi:E3 ubiquitin-protein ligase RMA1H1-like [Lolium rigidum]|uniref:E3 ubiquitin-protein ligase RMA1H1-like n=1 Tax=Lolium rigidum TaxID=89674 RepID=UPI001F5C0D12|nr:E3 ubiquitin-protein ligase RMA1H1-like [Lolium rigidum]
MNQASTAGASDPLKRSSGDCFDCNICLDFTVEPVVTRCGHLYCWPCIYEWLRRNGDEGHAGVSTGRPCPVCKGPLTLDSLVPLYGRGSSRSDKPLPHPAIPRRPAVHREAVGEQIGGGSGLQHVSTDPDWLTRSPGQAHHHHADAARFDVLYPPPRLGGGVNVMHSTSGGVLGGMAMAVLPLVFRGQVPASSEHYYSSPYNPAALQYMSPRLRRQHMEVERSLHQLLFFLFVFVLLCLLLF